MVIADQVDMGSFNFSYTFEDWHKDKRRRRRAVDRFVNISYLEDSFSFLSSTDDMMVNVI